MYPLMGGHVTAGESNEQALRREAEEELGLTGNYKFELAGKAIFNRQILGRKENHYFIVFKIFSDDVPKLNHESVDFRYFTEDEIRQELKSHPEIFGGGFHFVVKSIFPHLLA